MEWRPSTLSPEDITQSVCDSGGQTGSRVHVEMDCVAHLRGIRCWAPDNDFVTVKEMREVGVNSVHNTAALL